MADQQSMSKTVKRRGILLAAGAAVAGIAARKVAKPVAANDATWTFPYTGTGASAGNLFSVTNQGSGIAVAGTNTAGSPGLGGFGVFGDSTNSNGVYGTSDTNHGVFGITNAAGDRAGVIGSGSANNIGVFGTNGRIGVQGYSLAGVGVYGQTGMGLYGVRGDAGSAPGSAGLLGYTSTANGVAFGTVAQSPAEVAGYFNGTTVVNGNFAVTGSKSAAVKDAQGQHRLMYCVEAPEAWFEDVGKATLVNGKADVPLDPDFAALIHTDDYLIFLTSFDVGCKGLSVAAHSATGFAVQEQNGGTSSGPFSWRVMAKRADVTGERLAKFTLPILTMPEPIATPDTPTSPHTPLPAPMPRTATATTQTNAPNAVSTPTSAPPAGPAPAPPRRP